MLTIDQAAAVLSGPRKPGVAGYVEHATAAATYFALHEQRMGRGRRLMHDLAPGRIGDQEPALIGGETTQITQGGARPGSPSGGTLIAEFDGDNASAFIVLAHGNGKCGLYRIGKADGVMDPGQTTGDEWSRLTQDQKIARIEQWADECYRSRSATINRDARWNRNRLAEINRRNKSFWGGGTDAA